MRAQPSGGAAILCEGSQGPIYGLLMDDAKTSQVFEAGAPYGTLEPKKTALAEVIEESVRGDVRIIDWVSKDDVQRDIRSRIKRSLTAASYPDDARAKLAARILDLLKAREGR